MDDKTGQRVSRRWNELPEHTRNQIKGGSIVASFLLPAASVGKLGQYAKTGKLPDAPSVNTAGSTNAGLASHLDGLIAKGTVESADDVNKLYNTNYAPPYKPGTQVTEFISDGKTEFVRVYTQGKNRPTGHWIVKKSDIQDLTLEQIANKLALPYIPTHITSIKPLAGTKIRTGTVNPNFNRSGGGQQFEFIGNVPTKGWGNETAIK